MVRKLVCQATKFRSSRRPFTAFHSKVLLIVEMNLSMTESESQGSRAIMLCNVYGRLIHRTDSLGCQGSDLIGRGKIQVGDQRARVENRVYLIRMGHQKKILFLMVVPVIGGGLSCVEL